MRSIWAAGSVFAADAVIFVHLLALEEILWTVTLPGGGGMGVTRFESGGGPSREPGNENCGRKAAQLR